MLLFSLFLCCRSWPNIGGWHAVVSGPASGSVNHRPSPQQPSYTVGDQKYKVGELDRPQSYDLSKLPSFKHVQKAQYSSNQIPPRPHSEQTMCTLPSVQKVAPNSVTNCKHDLQSVSNGLSVRHSTYRSLASNPKLKVKAADGKLHITRRRPKSLPANLQQERQLHSSSSGGDERDSPQKEFYHRSRSPTLATLSKAKEQLDVALSRKLWNIRRQVDGQRARENSAAYSHISSAKTTSSADWYKRMLREHSDEDLAAIETLCIANHEDQMESSESLSLMAARPNLDIRFDSEYLKTHVNDWSILALMADEERKRREREMRKANRDAGRPSATMASMSRKPQPKKTQRKKPDPVLPQKREAVIIVPVSLPPVGNYDEVSEPKSEMSPDLPQTPSPVQDNYEPIVQDDEPGPPEDLIAKYLSNSTTTTDEPIQEPSEATQDSNNEEVDKQSDVSSKPSEPEKKLTEKEKFLLMRKRMEERQAEKAKQRERFNEFAGSGMTGNKSKNRSLGSLMSNRLEKMATFKSQTRDDDDEDDDDDYGSFDDDSDDDDDDD